MIERAEEGATEPVAGDHREGSFNAAAAEAALAAAPALAEADS